MEYVEAGDYNEARTLAVVITTVLQFTDEEVDLVYKAKEAHAGVLGTFFGAKAPGSGVSHNAMHAYNYTRKRSMG
jgi:hypothetical protein